MISYVMSKAQPMALFNSGSILIVNFWKAVFYCKVARLLVMGDTEKFTISIQY